MEKDYLFKKWLNGELNPEEEKVFDALPESNFSKDIISEAKRFKNQNPHQVISFQELEQRLQPHQKSNLLGNFIKIAAAVVIGFGIFSLLNRSNENNYITQLAQQENITLPDNSKVTLNSNSELSFDDSKWNDERKVQLKGEAFFDVAAGKRFDVVTSQGAISVLGTEFTVTVRDSIFEVRCYEGLVQVMNNNEMTKLPSGKGYIFSNNTSAVVDIFLAEPKWLQGLSVFENATIAKVFEELEKEYSIQINQNDIDATIQFTGAFENNNLNNALQQVTQSLDLTYEFINDKTVIIRNGSK